MHTGMGVAMQEVFTICQGGSQVGVPLVILALPAIHRAGWREVAKVDVAVGWVLGQRTELRTAVDDLLDAISCVQGFQFLQLLRLLLRWQEVMVATDQYLVAVQPWQKLRYILRLLPHDEVTEVDDGVLRPHEEVVPVDQGFVHLVHSGPGTVRHDFQSPDVTQV